MSDFNAGIFGQPGADHDWEAMWDAVKIARPVHYTLFTFGQTDLRYYLVLAPRLPGEQVVVRQGEIKIARPMIITPDRAGPEFENFFDDDEEAGQVGWMLARSASFSNLKFRNQAGPDQTATDNVEEVVSRLNRKLDTDDEDRVAILVAPKGLAGFALVKYAADRVIQSTPGNIQELREKGFLP